MIYLKLKQDLLFFLLFFLLVLSFLSCQKSGDAFQYEILLDEGWHIHSSAGFNLSGEAISSPDLEMQDWYTASVPTTVLAALVNNGVYRDLYFGKNLEKIPTEPFEHSWWFRKEFYLQTNKTFEHVRLGFEGINHKANIWLNGKKIASSDSIFGAFRLFNLDITEPIKIGKNVLAVEIFPPKPGDFTIGFVDWNPKPPDRNMGIWRPVKLHLNGPISINNTFVTSKINLETLTEAALTITTDIINHSDQAVSGTLEGELEEIEFSQELSLKPNEIKTVRLSPEKFEELNLRQARLWWPNNLGEQNLYKLKLSFLLDDRFSDEQKISFGIREVSDYINEEGHRGYKINGKKILIRGGGWVDDLMLADDSRTLEAKIKYTKHMNLNTIRLEGFWGSSQELYDLCDKYGILLMAGWSCHWEWDEYLGKACDEFGGIQTPEEMDLIAEYWRDQVVWLRNHPSIFVWLGGSDKLPRPQLEKKYLQLLEKYDGSRPYLAAAATIESEVSGNTRVKMNGPYDYVPPIYWYEDKSKGGAFGFNTETGPGPQPPPLESLKKMLPEDHLWPIDDYWEYHCARNEFNTLDRYEEALNHRYGIPNNVQEFVQKAQLMNYEAMRAMFEAFGAHKHTSTGIIQWMLNSAWPAMYWQLYDYYLMPSGAFYGTKKASEPLHILYHYSDNGVYVVNDNFVPLNNLKAEICVLDIHSREIFKEIKDINIEANTSLRTMQIPEIEGLSSVYFLDLKLKDASGKQVSDNFYWLSTKKDVMDYAGTKWFVTPIKEFADFTGLKDLPDIKINVQHSFEQISFGQKVQVTLENPTDTVAFFMYLNVVGKESGNSVLPIYWDDNYITLLPGEKRKLEAYFSIGDLKGDEPVLKVSGWNVTIK
jgi:exo-1,4-beta-D-glucosaminidase